MLYIGKSSLLLATKPEVEGSEVRVLCYLLWLLKKLSLCTANTGSTCVVVRYSVL